MTDIHAQVISGHQIASGQAKDSPYPKGSLEMQMPCFRERGLDLSHCYLGSLNLDISPFTFKIVKPDFTFPIVAWAEGFPPETFSFIACAVGYQGKWVDAYVYYPHPETKVRHFQSNSTLEIVAPFIEGIRYGDAVQLRLDDRKIALR